MREAVTLTTREAPCWTALVHVEIEALDRALNHRAWLHPAYRYLRKYQLPVPPITIYLHVGLKGIGSA